MCLISVSVISHQIAVKVSVIDIRHFFILSTKARNFRLFREMEKNDIQMFNIDRDELENVYGHDMV